MTDGSVTNKAMWAGRIISGLAVAFMLMDGVMKLSKPGFVVDATVKLGFPESTIVGIGVALLFGTVLYVIPRTAVLGAVWLTDIWEARCAARCGLRLVYSTSCFRGFSRCWCGSGCG